MIGRQPVHDDVEAVRATLRWGVRMTLAVVVPGILYSLLSAGPNRTLLLLVFLSAAPAALAVTAIDPGRLAAWPRRSAFFAGWSLLCIAQITLLVALDVPGGPLAALYVLPLLFIVMSYPLWLVAALGAAAAASYTTVALVLGGVSVWAVVFYAIVLVWTSIFGIVAASEQRRQREVIASLSLRDPLTGLANRTVLMERLRRAVAGHAGTEQSLAVLFFDLDDFKDVNDSLGHPAGDSLLCQVVERLRGGLRGDHLIARFGGDELVVVCERLRHPGEAVMIAERLAEAIRARPFHLASGEHHVTASVGVAVDAADGSDADTLIRDADAAMYRAKAAGRGRVEIFDDLLRRRIVERVGLERDLRRALDADELFVVYQPIIAFGDPRPRVEALVRWRHPERGIVPPLDFIGLAEQTGLITELGERVLLLACTQVAAWQREVPGLEQHRVSVNVSPRQLADPSFPSRVASVLAATGLPAESLVLEITESALLDHGTHAEERLRSLRALGVGVSLDDFGTGHSSVTSLLSLPIGAIKLDRTFVADIVADERQAAVVRGLVALGRDLGLHTIVEGVETREQLERLRELGCDNFQGFYFSRPVEAGAYLDWAAAA